MQQSDATGKSPGSTDSKAQAATHFQRTDLRAGAQLGIRATTGVIDIVEGVHQAVLRTLGVSREPAPRTGGLTGRIYRSIRGLTRLVGGTLDRALTALEPALPDATGSVESDSRLAVLAALNGVLGDHLTELQSPLAIPMRLYVHGRELPAQPTSASALPVALHNGRLLLVIHGLCMHERHWQAADGPIHTLVQTGGYLPLALRYNSGNAIAHNGRQLAQLLEQVLAHWPVPVQSLTVVAHSMGGLLIRSAVAQAASDSCWREKLDRIVFLGTPHHGAPLERIGNSVDSLLGSLPWSAPFARLGQMRSSGITDLRHGHVIDHYPSAVERFSIRHDQRSALPLPSEVHCYAIAASLAQDRAHLQTRLLGDGLVPLPSALGQHDESHLQLDFPEHAQRIVYGTGHLQLLKSQQVTEQLLQWLA